MLVLTRLYFISIPDSCDQLADGIVSDPDTRQRSKSVSGKKKRKPKVSGPTGSKNRLKRAITLDDGTLRRQAPIMVRL